MNFTFKIGDIVTHRNRDLGRLCITKTFPLAKSCWATAYDGKHYRFRFSELIRVARPEIIKLDEAREQRNKEKQEQKCILTNKRNALIENGVNEDRITANATVDRRFDAPMDYTASTNPAGRGIRATGVLYRKHGWVPRKRGV